MIADDLFVLILYDLIEIYYTNIEQQKSILSKWIRYYKIVWYFAVQGVLSIKKAHFSYKTAIVHINDTDRTKFLVSPVKYNVFMQQC